MTDKRYALARRYLGRVYTLQTGLERKRRRIREARDMAEGTTSQVSGMPHGSGAGSKVEAAVARIDELEREIRSSENELRAVRDEIAGLLSGIEDPECSRVMLERYVLCRDWAEISGAVPECRRTVYRHHRDGLRFVNERLGAEELPAG